MVGSAIVRTLQAAGHTHIVTRTHAELDLTDQAAVRAFFALEKPDQVYLAAAKVEIGRDYPAPIVDHAQARERTLARYAVVKTNKG